MKWYQYDIRDLSEHEYKKWYSLMSEEKKKRVNRFRFQDDKKRTVVGEMLARKAFSEWCNVSVEDIIFDVTEYGKPFVKGLSVEFNISHSADMVVCAINDKPIGIDIEKIRPIDLSIAKRICTDEELNYIFNHIPPESDFSYTENTALLTRFFKIWTAKEAISKYLGKGISLSWSSIIQTEYLLYKKMANEDYIITICYGKV